MIYQGEYTKEISFPLGGIGSGSVGLAGNGQLIDWEIFNRPSKGSLNGFTHFAVKAKTKSGVITRILNGDHLKEYSGQYGLNFGEGVSSKHMVGFPHFRNWSFSGTFPMATVNFSDPDFPAKVALHAFNPMIPLDEDNSSIPGAFFEVEMQNTQAEAMEYQVAFSIGSPYPFSTNQATLEQNIRMLSIINTEKEKHDIEYGDLTIATDCPDTLTQTYWYRGGWCDGIVTFWNNFNQEQDLEERIYQERRSEKGISINDHGTIVAKLFLEAKETKKVRFVLTWNVPNNYNYWQNKSDKPWKNYYAVLFENSKASAAYAFKHWDMLYKRTERFTKLLHQSSVDPVIMDAISSTLSVLKSPTVFRLQDGSFYGWEGVHEKKGSCEGTCQHVWNYAYALCFLFPCLERSIRENEFTYTILPSGQSAFRLRLPLELNPGGFRPCLDGQMGLIIKSYREWKISGDDAWLKKYWDKIKLLLDFARSKENPDEWDLNGDGILEGRQHHTLDMELFGPSAWLEGMYVAALKAGSEMAEYIGEKEKAREYRSLFEKGKQFIKEQLFNGAYFIQKIDLKEKAITEHFDVANYWNDEVSEIKYQIAEGCSIDQLLGQWHADLVGLGEIFEEEQIDIALDSMYDNLFKESMRTFVNPWRIFSLNDEAGTVICDYPEGVKKPHIPVPYCEETMTGFEYSFAGILLQHGKMDKALSVIKAVRDRYDGKKRNPYNEIECGSNYARAMSSFAFLPILSGFSYDLSKDYVGFAPITREENFQCFFSLGTGWGTYVQTAHTAEIVLAEGQLTLSSLGLSEKILADVTCLEVDGKKVEFSKKECKLVFEQQVIAHMIKAVF